LAQQINLDLLRCIEELEYRYLNKLDEMIKNNISNIVSAFKRRFLIYKDWINYLETERKRLTDLGIGAERVFWKIISNSFYDWCPVALFIGSNLFFETAEAFINIDVKTVYVDNLRDYMGLVEVGDAQTSYPMTKTYGALEPFKPKIKPYYNVNGVRKYSLAYFIQIVYEKPEIIMSMNLDQGPIAILLISMPNGMLYDIYGDEIVRYPKSYITREGRRIRPANYRYYYSEEPCYKLLQSKPCNYRIRLYFNEKYNGYYREGLYLRITPHIIASLKRRCNNHDCNLFYFSIS